MIEEITDEELYHHSMVNAYDLITKKKSLEDKFALITVTEVYRHPLCDCCCDHPDDVLNFVSYDKESLVSEKTVVTIEGE